VVLDYQKQKSLNAHGGFIPAASDPPHMIIPDQVPLIIE